MRGLTIIALSIGALCLAACAQDEEAVPTAEEELAEYLRVQYGVTYDRFALDQQYEVDENGEVTAEATGVLSLQGLGSRELYMAEVIIPEAEGGGVVLHVEETASGDGRWFLYDVRESFILFSQDLSAPDDEDAVLRGAAVGRNPDGTYSVWTFDEQSSREGETIAADGYEALRLVEQYNDFSTITPHVMLAAVVLGHATVPEARDFSICSNIASPPAVCSIFEEFCECAACSVLKDSGASCDLCPQLTAR